MTLHKYWLASLCITFAENKKRGNTDNSMFPLENDVMKFEIFPPGHAATNSIPSATIGEICSLNIIVNRNVNAGRSMIWHIIPTTIDFGFRTISRNDDGLIPSATPNMTKARTMFMMSIPTLFILTSIASINAIISGSIISAISQSFLFHIRTSSSMAHICMEYIRTTACRPCQMHYYSRYPA